MAIDGLEKELESALDEIAAKSKFTVERAEKKIRVFDYKGKLAVSINKDKRYIEFHGEYMDINSVRESLMPIAGFLHIQREDYRSNFSLPPEIEFDDWSAGKK